jgi:hypothetical protein
MFSPGIILMAVVLTASAVPRYESVPRDESWRETFSRLMVATFQKTTPETGKCGDRCYIFTGEEGLLLDVGEDYIDPENPCNPYVCKEDGLTQTSVTCVPVKDIPDCDDGNPPFVPPGRCCATCGPGENKPPPDLFTGWAQWTRCTRTCGGGTRARRRECALTPDGGFVDCRGKTLQVESCNKQECPKNCEYIYEEFGPCNVTCGEGVRLSYPKITQHPTEGGEPCPPEVLNNIPRTLICVGPTCPPCKEGETLCRNATHPNFMKCQEDNDGDCVPNKQDNCVNVSNVGQSDQEDDKIGDACDNCPSAINTDQANSDDDRTGDACDPDDDNDGIADTYPDNCRTVKNRQQENRDDDTYGDECDNCKSVTNENQNDWDGDGWGNACDNCRYACNRDQDDPKNYGASCTTKSLGIPCPDEDVLVASDKKGLAAEIMEKLLEMYYSN